MSRNRTLSQVVDKLPPLNKVTRDGKLMYDEKGRSIPVDHAREIQIIKNQIRDRYGKRLDDTLRAKMREDELQAIGLYCEEVIFLRNKYLRGIRTRVFKWAISIISCTGLALYIWLRYF